MDVDIGSITQLNGNTRVVRDKPYESEIDFSLNSMDKLETAQGRMGVTFRDDTTIRLTEHSNVTIDKFVFDPDPAKSTMALSFVKGTGRFISSKTKRRIPKDNITIRTNAATIGIRGTDFTATVDELGKSLIILLPDALGLSSGEIEVVTAMGSVLLNKPFEATTVSVFESAPSAPVVLDLTLELIDNMLIVSPPKEVVEMEQQQTVQSANILDFNDLDIDYLDEDLLADDELQNAGVVRIVGTAFGQDKDTQITTFMTGEILTLQRNVSNSARIDIDKSGSYTIIFIQDGVSRQVTVNGGSNSVIKISQGS